MNKITIEAPGWKLIDEIGWGTKTTDYEAVSKYLYSKYCSGTVKNLRCFVNARNTELRRDIDAFEKQERPLKIGSDDGYNDVIVHVIGMGRAEFLNVRANPLLLEKRYHQPRNSLDGYEECFTYCFLPPEYNSLT